MPRKNEGQGERPGLKPDRQADRSVTQLPASASRLPFIPAALDDLGLDVYAFRVYCRIARRAGESGTCFESIPKMAKELKLWRPTVTRAVKQLQERHMVKVVARQGQTSVITPLPAPEWATPTRAENRPGTRDGNRPATRAENRPQRYSLEGTPLKVDGIRSDVPFTKNQTDTHVGAQRTAPSRWPILNALQEQAGQQLSLSLDYDVRIDCPNCHKNTLDVRIGDNGAVVLCCHGGEPECPVEDIVAGYGCTMADLYPQEAQAVR